MTELPSRAPVRAPGTPELIAAQLRREIIRGTLAPGDSLPPQPVLMEHFGVSAPTVHAVLRILEADGLVTVRRGVRGGAIVNAPVPDVAAQHAGILLQHQQTPMAEVFEAYADLEVPAATRLARRRDPEVIQRLREELRATETPPSDPAERMRAHARFHLLVIELAGNRTATLFAQMISHIVQNAQQRWAHLRFPQEQFDAATRRASHLAHVHLVDAIESGDISRAEKIWQDHVESVTRYFVDFYGPTTVLEVLD